MESLLTKLTCGKLSTFAAITLMFTYTILLDRDFVCNCKSQDASCDLYMSLPFFIILLLILWTDGSFQRVCRYLCSGSSGCCRPNTKSFWDSFLRHVLKAALVGLLWVAFVLLDGDWYVCCKNDSPVAYLACKGPGPITEIEREIIADLKNKSGTIGGFILFGIVLMASLMPLCCKRRSLYEKLILEEEDNVLREILRKSAKDQLTKEVEDRIRGGQREECFNVAVDLIDASARPTTSEEQHQPAQDANSQVPMTNMRNNKTESDSIVQQSTNI